MGHECRVGVSLSCLLEGRLDGFRDVHRLPLGPGARLGEVVHASHDGLDGLGLFQNGVHRLQSRVRTVPQERGASFDYRDGVHHPVV